MRRTLAVLPVAVLLALVGCNHWPPRNDTGTGAPPPVLSLKTEPKAADLVAYLNDNAHRVPGLFCKNVRIDATSGNQTIGMDATMACEKARNFRMKAVVAGSPAADFGSNQDEFWYWVTKNEPPYVFHGKYADMNAARSQPPIPFQPDLVIAALGIGDYDPNGKYEVRSGKEFVELIETSASITGKPVWKVTVFNRGAVTAAKPQVVAYRLIDVETRKDIAVANVTSTQVNRETGAVLPRSIQLILIPERAPTEKVEMKLVFDNLQVKTFDNDQRATIFALRDALGDSRQGYDLVRGAADPAPGTVGTGMSIQRTNGTTYPPR